MRMTLLLAGVPFLFLLGCEANVESKSGDEVAKAEVEKKSAKSTMPTSDRYQGVVGATE